MLFFFPGTTGMDIREMREMCALSSSTSLTARDSPENELAVS
jgi:hypothetical protein